MGKYLDPSDVVLSHTLTEAELAFWIEQAESRLATALRRRGVSLSALAETLASDPDRCDDIRNVLLGALVSVIRNPEGYASESEDGYSFSRSTRTASGDIYYSDADLDRLAPRARWGSMQMGMPAHRLLLRPRP